MLKKNEVLAILERGGSIHVDTISRSARVVDVNGEWLDCCRYDVAERIEHSDGYRRRKTDWFATYYIEIDPPAEEAQEEAAPEEPEETAQERTDRENRETCRRIAKELEAHEAGRVYRCPECGQTFECEDLYELEREAEDWPGYIYALPCGCETTTEPEQMSLYDYFEDCLDIEYRCDGRREYRSVCIMVACGGPNIYVDTESKAVELYWWGDRASYSLLPDTVEAVDAWADTSAETATGSLYFQS